MKGPLLKNRYCSENLYKKQKETISKINSEKKSNTQNYPPKTVQSNQRVVKFSPDNNQWVYTTFSTLLNKKTKEESPLIVNDTWSESNRLRVGVRNLGGSLGSFGSSGAKHACFLIDRDLFEYDSNGYKRHINKWRDNDYDWDSIRKCIEWNN